MPRQIDLFPNNLQVDYNPTHQIGFTGDQFEAFLAELPELIKEAFEKAIWEILAEIDTLTGLDLVDFAHALQTLFGTGGDLLAQLLNNIPLITPLIQDILGITAGTGTGDPLTLFTTLLGDIIHVIGAPTGLGTGSPLPGPLATNPILVPLYAAMITALGGSGSSLSTLETLLGGLTGAVEVLAQHTLDDLLSFVTGSTVSGGSISALPSALTSWWAAIPATHITGTAGDLNAHLLSGIDASQIVSGTFSNSFVPGLALTWNNIVSALGGPSTGNTASDVAHYLGNIPGANIIGTLSGAVIPALPISGVTGLAAYLANLSPSGILALAGLASGALPAGITLPGGQITGAGSIAATLLASLDASKITTGTFTTTQIPSLDASKITTGVFGTGQIPNITKAMSTDLQSVIDNIYQAINGGVTTGNTLASVKTSLQAIPGGNISTAISSSIVPSLDASKITTGTFGAALIPALPSGWGKTIDSSLLVNAISSAIIPSLDASKITTGTFGTGLIPALDASKITTGTLGSAQIPALGSGWGKTIDSSLLVNAISSGLIPSLDASKIATGTFGTARIPNITIGMSTDMQSLVDNMYQAIYGGTSTGNTIASIKTALGVIPGANIVSLAATKLTAGALAAGVTLAGSQLTGSVAASLVSGALSGATLAATALTSGAIPSGVTLAGSQLTGSVAAALVSGVLATGNIPNVTAAMSTDLQAVVDNIYQAIHGGTTTGNLVSTVKSSLQAIPGANLTGSVAASLVSGALSGATLAATALTTGAIPAGVTLPGGQVTGTLGTAQIPALPSGWGKTIDGSLLAGAVAGSLVSGALSGATLAASALTSGAIPSGVTVDAARITSGVLAAAQIPAITSTMAPALAPIDTLVNAWGITGTGHTTTDLTAAAQSLPSTVVAGVLSAADIGATAQNTVDATIQGILGNTATGNTQANLTNALTGALKNFLGYNPSGSTPAGSVAANATSSATYINNTAYYKYLQAGLDATTNGPYDIGLLQFTSAASPPTIPMYSQQNAAYNVSPLYQCTCIAFVATVNAGTMKCVRWAGYPTGGTLANINGFFVHIWKLDPSTGNMTAVHQSANIVGGLGTGTAPAWQFYTLPTPIVAAQTDVYVIELEMWGTGQYNVMGIQQGTVAVPYTSRPGWPGGTRYVGYTGNGNANLISTSPKSGVGNIIGNINSLINADTYIVAFAVTSCTTTGAAWTMQYAGQNMTQLATKQIGTGQNFLTAYGIAAPFGGYGPQTLQLNQTVAGKSWYASIWGTAFTGVNSVDTANILSTATTGGNGSAAFNYTANKNAIQAVAVCADGSTMSATSGFTPVGGTTNAASYFNLICGVSYPPANTATCTRSAGNSGVMVVPLICSGTQTLADPLSTDAAMWYNYLPWIGLSNTVGTSQSGPPPPPPPVPPQLYTFNTVGSGQNWTPPYWCNSLDIIAFAGGNGGDAGASLTGSNGGACGGVATTTVPISSLTGGHSAYLTFNIGAGGTGGASTSVPGGGGSNTSVVLPGVGTLTANAAAPRGSVSSTGNQRFGAGQNEPNQSYNGNNYTGGLGGQSAQSGGAQPGAGGAGGNAQIYGSLIYGGPGGNGQVQILAYQ